MWDTRFDSYTLIPKMNLAYFWLVVIGVFWLVIIGVLVRDGYGYGDLGICIMCITAGIRNAFLTKFGCWCGYRLYRLCLYSILNLNLTLFIPSRHLTWLENASFGTNACFLDCVCVAWSYCNVLCLFIFKLKQNFFCLSLACNDHRSTESRYSKKRYIYWLITSNLWYFSRFTHSWK